MVKKQALIFQSIIIAFIFAITFLSAILNAYALRRNTIDAGAENTSVLLSMVMEKFEYGLHYGREIENYYGIEEVLEEIAHYCEASRAFISDEEGGYLYGEEPPEDIREKIGELKESGQKTLVYEKDKTQYVLRAIEGTNRTEGYVGISYPQSKMLNVSKAYVHQIVIRAVLAAILGALLFEILFHMVKHGFQKKKLRILILLTIITTSIGSVVSTFFIVRDGYRYLANEVSQNLLELNSTNIERLIMQGVAYGDMEDADGYFQRISSGSAQVESFILSRNPVDDATSSVSLPADSFGEKYYLSSVVSGEYINGKLFSAILNVIVTMVTGLMLSGEILGFLIDIVGGEKKNRMHRVDNTEHKTIETIGIVRGISFFFAGFRFMAVAFMSIVLAEIYKPVSIFGITIPKALLMSVPMSAQVFISMLTSYLSGIVIGKMGWKPPALGGILVMIFGTVASAFANAPVPFILAQMFMGVGLGFAKMGIDLYAVAVSSESDMAEYTAGANAAIIVGYSCAASIGALIASIFGYSGAYLVMGGIGISVFLILLYFGMDVEPRKEQEEEAALNVSKWNGKGPDIRFSAYILCVIIPYYFIMMFVDYFFPVFSNSRGITTDIIGLVMMVYGIATAYIGAALCPPLAKKVSPSVLMSAILLVLSVSVAVFSVWNAVIPAFLVVVLIGVADGIMPSIQFEYVYALPFAKKVGFSKALGIEGFFSNLIGAVAPVVFGIVMLYGSRGLTVVGGAVIVLSTLFLAINTSGGIHRGKEV